MNKKFLGIKVGTWISAIVCLIIALFIWIYVEYDKAINSPQLPEISEDCSDS